MQRKPNVIKNMKKRITPSHCLKSNANSGTIYESKYSVVIVFSSFTSTTVYECVPSVHCVFNSLNRTIKLNIKEKTIHPTPMYSVYKCSSF